MESCSDFNSANNELEAIHILQIYYIIHTQNISYLRPGSFVLFVHTVRKIHVVTNTGL